MLCSCRCLVQLQIYGRQQCRWRRIGWNKHSGWLIGVLAEHHDCNIQHPGSRSQAYAISPGSCKHCRAPLLQLWQTSREKTNIIVWVIQDGGNECQSNGLKVVFVAYLVTQASKQAIAIALHALGCQMWPCFNRLVCKHNKKGPHLFYCFIVFPKVSPLKLPLHENDTSKHGTKHCSNTNASILGAVHPSK